MLSEDQKIRLRVLFVLAAMACAAVGLLQGWPIWAWLPFSAFLLVTPPLISYAAAEWVLLRGGRYRRAGSTREQVPDEPGTERDGHTTPGRTTPGQTTLGPTTLDGTSTAGCTDEDDAHIPPAARHAAALVRTLPAGERQTMFARGLAKVLDAHELHDAADSMRTWFDAPSAANGGPSSTRTNHPVRTGKDSGVSR